jgi:hypothetical protein
MAEASKITVFLKDGLPRGIREISLDQWSGRALCAPRNRMAEIFRGKDVADSVAVYFLMGKEEGLLNVYVGEADGVGARFKDHDAKKDWWDTAILFVDKGLNKTRAQYIESRCVEQLKASGRCLLMNKNEPAKPTIAEEDIPGSDKFYDNVRLLVPFLGYDIFAGAPIDEKWRQHLDIPPDEYLCGNKRVLARGMLLGDGKMRVLGGSTAESQDRESFAGHSYQKLKEQLIALKRLIPDGQFFKFDADYDFDSPSAAAAVILGRSANGRVEWKMKDGRTLSEREDV